MKEQTFTCVVCPMGCELTVQYQEGADSADCKVSGNTCPRGAAYAKSEIFHPERTLTSTVRTDSKLLPMCPVKTDAPIPKEKLFDAMKVLNALSVKVPVTCGDVLEENFAGTGVKLVACRTIVQ